MVTRPREAYALHTKVGELLAHATVVAAYSDSVISRVSLDGVTVTALGVAHRRGAVGPTIVSGRAPRADGEIALGAKTLDRIGLGVGDTVRGRSRTRAARRGRSGWWAVSCCPDSVRIPDPTRPRSARARS